MTKFKLQSSGRYTTVEIVEGQLYQIKSANDLGYRTFPRNRLSHGDICICVHVVSSSAGWFINENMEVTKVFNSEIKEYNGKS